jgi:hypothetical protein
VTTTVPQHAASPTEVIAGTLVRRAQELARDPRVTLAEGAHNLVRLAKGRSRVLERALAELGQDSLGSAEREHARILLQRALEETARAPVGESVSR